MGNPIPTESRRVVNERDKGLCARCRGKGTEWHHRRSRSVRDEHCHCPCNGILLCNTCHMWAHAHPFEARSKGWIVSRYATPAEQQLEHARIGWVTLTCDGNWNFAKSYEEEHDDV